MSEKLVNSEPLERSKFKNPSRELGILPSGSGTEICVRMKWNGN